MNSRSKHDPTDNARAVLGDFQWNEHVSGGMERAHPFLISIICIKPGQGFECIGTAFIIGAYGNQALAVSAAHNFWDAIWQHQNPPSASRHHPTALPLFLPPPPKISLDWFKVRAIYQVGERLEMCTIKSVVWDKAADIAILKLTTEDETDSTVFNHLYQLNHVSSKVGDIVACMGYANMGTSQEPDNWKRGVITRRAVLRVGRVLALHPDGHARVRGPCIETSIPVFGGMSGGPVFLLPPLGEAIVPFALISTDLDAPDEVKNDRSRPGSSIMAILPLEAVAANGIGHVRIRLYGIDIVGDLDYGPRAGSPVSWEPD